MLLGRQKAQDDMFATQKEVLVKVEAALDKREDAILSLMKDYKIEAEAKSMAEWARIQQEWGRIREEWARYHKACAEDKATFQKEVKDYRTKASVSL